MRGLREHRRWLIGQALVWGVGAAVLRLAVVPAEACPPVSAPAVQEAMDEAAAWLVRGQREDGRFLYGYDRDRDQVSRDYNFARHAGVMLSLYQLGQVEAADAGLRFVLDNLVNNDDWTAFAPSRGIADVGPNALVLAALIERRRDTGDERYDPLARRIGRFLVSQTQPDGSVLQLWRLGDRKSVPGVYGMFATGEVFYALALLNTTFPGEGWAEPAHRIADYLATRRARAEGFSVRQADHWAAYGLDELESDGLTEVEVDYARWLAGYFGYLIRFEAQHTDGALNPLPESGASIGTDGEAAAALWRLAGKEPRLADLRDDLGERITCLAGILVERQVPAAEANALARGAWFADGYTQMDDQQHAASALVGASEVAR